MAERFQIKGVSGTTPIAAAAPAIMLAKAEPLFALGGAAASGHDAEALHDMRVASRRLREALQLFEPFYPRREFRAWYAVVRRVTRALGLVRDADVFIAAFESLVPAADSEAELAALAYLIGFRRGERRAELERLGRRLKRMDLGSAKRRFEKFASRPRTRPESNRPLAILARDSIVPRLDTVYGFLPAALTPENAEAQHAMRIACKRLRYCIETMAPCLGEALPALFEPFRRLQDALGELHDIDVFSDAVRGALAEREPAAAGVRPEGFEAVLGHLAAERAKRFARFKRLVDDHPQTRMRAAVLTALATAGAFPKPPPDAGGPDGASSHPPTGGAVASTGTPADGSPADTPSKTAP